jgi:hypothetical protein
LAIAALFVSGTLLKLLYGALAVLLGLFSAYRIWLKEYDRAEHQLALNTHPEIVIEMFYCFWSYPTGASDPMQILAFVRLTNVRAVDTLIKRYRLTITTEARTFAGEAVPPLPYRALAYENDGETIPGSTPFGRSWSMLQLDPLKFTPQDPLTKGIYRDGWLNFSIEFRDYSKYKSPRAVVILAVKDAFDVEHRSLPKELVMRYSEIKM